MDIGMTGQRLRKLATALILAAAACVPARAASPLQDYIAARDGYLKQFKDSTVGDDNAVTKAHDEALRDLATRLRPIIGPLQIAGFPDSKVNLESLSEGDQGFGLLDGLVYSSSDQKSQVVVTTDELLSQWLTAHKTWWDGKDDIPPGTEAALKSESFYTQALNTDAHFFAFGDIPLAKPAGATFAYATLIGRGQDVGRQTPNEIVVTLQSGGRLFVAVAPTNVKIGAAPTCAQNWKKAEKQAQAAADVDKGEAIREAGYDAYRRCFAAQAPRQSYFAAVVKQAQGLVDKLPTK
jgi:hypothetical protein